MDEDELIGIYNGWLQRPIVVGRLDWGLARLIGANNNTVWLYPDDMKKMRFKHRLKEGHFFQIGLAMQYGRVIRDAEKSLCFIHHDEVVYRKSFYAVIKATGEGHMLILNSFRKIRPDALNSKIRKWPTIRPHWNE